MGNALPSIVDTFVAKAKEGSIPHAKALAELSGLDKTFAPIEDARGERRRRRGPTLTEMLMRELKRGGEAKGGKEGQAPEAGGEGLEGRRLRGEMKWDDTEL